MQSAIRISIPSFLDYAGSTPRDCASIVKGQRSIYLDPASLGPHFYAPFRAAMRRAVNSVDPQGEIDAAVSNAWQAQLPHYSALQAGFEQWWAKARATGVPVGEGEWCEGGLEVKIRGALGLRRADGGTEVVLPYLKAPELAAGAANLALRILERQMPQLLPEAAPVVLDVRRGKPFRLRRNANRRDLDALLAAEAAKYVTHWRAIA